MKYCIKCGAQMEDEWNVCQNCGNGAESSDLKAAHSYPQKEIIKFSQQFLVPKIFVLGMLCYFCTLYMLDEGVVKILVAGDWVPFIIYAIIEFLLEAWIKRDLINYAGNLYMLNLGISKSAAELTEKILQIGSKVISIVTGVLYVVAFLQNFGDYGISWYTLLQPILKYRDLVLIDALLDVAKKLVMCYREVTKEEFEEEEKKDDLQ